MPWEDVQREWEDDRAEARSPRGLRNWAAEHAELPEPEPVESRPLTCWACEAAFDDDGLCPACDKDNAAVLPEGAA